MLTAVCEEILLQGITQTTGMVFAVGAKDADFEFNCDSVQWSASQYKVAQVSTGKGTEAH